MSCRVTHNSLRWYSIEQHYGQRPPTIYSLDKSKHHTSQYRKDGGNQRRASRKMFEPYKKLLAENRGKEIDDLFKRDAAIDQDYKRLLEMREAVARAEEKLEAIKQQPRQLAIEKRIGKIREMYTKVKNESEDMSELNVKRYG
ncbi:hypothetical protein M501DRAFT_1034502 [Patellaria atrata CBS 101060]|uniref:Uncharacterized protein n=1 Tax=Patellaria atrata CBS 101060 TaxID=1346257 RepID=A0A9P4S3E7_9PEZI|nr:hypothetical protein M501DRAFT_1034502 [Patellaria atrata CBS 101060]